MAMGKQTWEPRDSAGSIFFVLEKKVFAGEQVLWTYGDDRSMDDFFLYYGFGGGRTSRDRILTGISAALFNDSDRLAPVIPDHFADDVQLFGTPKEFVQWCAHMAQEIIPPLRLPP